MFLSGGIGKGEARMKQLKISRPVMERLPVYLHYLKSLPEKPEYISSTVISRALRLGEVQVRKDLGIVSGAGKPKIGYGTLDLIHSLEEFLGYNSTLHAVIVGAGNLGRALAATRMFKRRGVTVLALFDTNPKIIGSEIYGLPVYSVDILGEYCKTQGVSIGILTVPKEAAAAVAKEMTDAGVRGLWNFANMELSPESDDVIVENIHLGDSLMTLCYELKTASKKEDEK